MKKDMRENILWPNASVKAELPCYSTHNRKTLNYLLSDLLTAEVWDLEQFQKIKSIKKSAAIVLSLHEPSLHKHTQKGL